MKPQSNFGKFAIKYKVGLRHLGYRLFSALPILCIAGFKGREK